MAATPGPPMTGVSSILMPAPSSSDPAMRRESAGAIVLMSHTTGRAPDAAIPRGPERDVLHRHGVLYARYDQRACRCDIRRGGRGLGALPG